LTDTLLQIIGAHELNASLRLRQQLLTGFTARRSGNDIGLAMALCPAVRPSVRHKPVSKRLHRWSWLSACMLNPSNSQSIYLIYKLQFVVRKCDHRYNKGSFLYHALDLEISPCNKTDRRTERYRAIARRPCSVVNSLPTIVACW